MPANFPFIYKCTIKFPISNIKFFFFWVLLDWSQFSGLTRSLEDEYENIIYDLITILKLSQISTNKKQKTSRNMEKGVVGGIDAVLAGIRAADARNFGDAVDADRTLSQLRVASSIAPDQLIWILDWVCLTRPIGNNNFFTVVVFEWRYGLRVTIFQAKLVFLDLDGRPALPRK